MRAFPVSVPQAGKVRLAWSHQTGTRMWVGSQGPQLGCGMVSRDEPIRAEPPALGSPGAEEDLGWPFPS